MVNESPLPVPALVDEEQTSQVSEGALHLLRRRQLLNSLPADKEEAFETLIQKVLAAEDEIAKLNISLDSLVYENC